MGRTIKSNVLISEIEFDAELYPRFNYNWHTAYDYSQSLKTGAKFPPIILAMLDGKKYLVDGKHRIEAYKLLKIDKIPAIINTGWNKQRIFREAIATNIAHGRSLTPYDKRRISLKLMEMKVKHSDISKLIQIPEDKLENFVGQRLVNSITGEDITLGGEGTDSKREVIKSVFKHLAGSSLNPEQMQVIEGLQESIYSGTQFSLLNQVVKMFETSMWNLEDKRVSKLIVNLKLLLEDY